MAERKPDMVVRGFAIYDGLLDADTQARIVDDLRHVASVAPFFRPTTSRGQQMSVRMTSAGRYGWISDGTGYRYASTHPDGTPWPSIPRDILEVWDTVSGVQRQPECCLVNFYAKGARMGLHQDRDEADFSWPVVSISLGDAALFRIGSNVRGGKTESLWLRSGDVVVMGGRARLTYHGVDRIDFGSSALLSQGGRINITLRVVD